MPELSVDTIFHKIIRREIPAEIVYEDDLVICFKDIAPVAPIHILVVPKKTLPKVSDAKKEDRDLLGHIVWVAAQIAEKEGLAGYRLVMNCGSAAGQTVFQLHLHLLGGRDLEWPPG